MALKKIPLSICCLLILGLTACSQPLTLKEEVLMLKKPPIKNESIKIEDLFNPYMTAEGFSNMALNEGLELEYNQYRILTSEMALADIDLLFQRLKTTYGGYMAFGGEQIFQKAKENITKAIGDKNIDAMDLEDLMIKHLSFLEDAHFKVNDRVLGDFGEVQLAEDIAFQKNGDKYEFMSNESQVDLSAIEKYIKPSLSRDGHVVYKAFRKGINLEKNDISAIHWKALENIDYGEDLEPEYNEIEGVPLLRVKRFYHVPSQKEAYDFVLNHMPYLSKADYSILDLRGNIGGNGILENQMLRVYSGKNINLSADGVIYFNLDNENTGGLQTNTQIKKNLENMGIQKYDSYHYFIKADRTMIEREGLLFVLIDGNSASASEWAIDGLKHFTNTIFVGVPSRGMMTGSSGTNTVLSNSKILVSWGNSYIHLNRAYFKEFYGFEPDLWVEPQYAEESVLNFIKNLRSDKRLN